MSKFSNTISYNLRTTLDASGITQLQGQLASISTQLDQMESKKLISPKEVYAAQRDIKQLGDALSSSLSPQTGILDINKFQKQLGGLSLSQLEQSMSKVGDEGKQAFGNMIAQIGRMDTSFKSISSFADKIFNTMGNTVRWGVTASIFQTIQNNLYRAVEYVQELDTSLNNIRIVTNASSDDMRNFALNANQAAQALGSSTTSFTDAAQLYAQNGFNEKDYTRLAEITQKVANVTQQNTTDVSEQITALMEGYGMSIDQVEKSLSGMSVVAAESAADLEELATAEQKVASTASTLGVSQDQLTAQIGTIVSVTRQAPESVGNAMRTLYARIADLKMGDTLEDGVTLGDVSKQLSEIGVQVLDEEGNLRNLGDVLEDLQAKWGDLSNAQQIALGNMLAGKHQLNPFMALMENADMYNDQLNMMQNSAGALDKQQSIYLDSMQAKLQQLSTAGEGLVSNLFNSDDIKPAIDALTDLLNVITQIVNALGGLNGILPLVVGNMTKAFSNQLGQAINNRFINYTRSQSQKASAEDIITQMGGVGDISGHSVSAQFINDNYDLQGRMSKEQREAYNTALQDTVNLENKVVAAEKQEVLAQQELVQFMRDKTLVTHPLTDIEKNASGDTMTDLSERKEKVQSFNKVIDNTRERLNNLNDTQKKIADGVNTYADAYTQMQNAVKGYGKALEDAGIDVQDLMSKLSSIGRGSSVELIEEQKQAIEDFLNTLKAKTNEEASIVEGIEARVNNLNESKKATSAAKSAMDAQGKALGAQTEGNKTQVQIQDIVRTTGAVTQLIFAWQSFQSLGSIWANADLTDGEKIAQTLENILFLAPNLVSGIADVSDSLTGLSPAATAFQQALKAAKDSGTTGFAAIKTAAVSATVALDGTAAGATAVGTAIKGILTSSVGLAAISAIIAGISIAFGVWQQSEQDRIDSINQKADEATETLNNLDSATDNFDTVYEAYKKGTASSEELSTAADTLNGYLDDQNQKALAASESWDAYANSLDAATQAARNSAIGDLQAKRDEVAANANKAVNRGNTYETYYNSDNAKDTATYQLIDRAGLSGVFNAAYNGHDLQIGANVNMEQAVEYYQQLVDYIDANSDWINTLSKTQQQEIADVRKQAEDVLNDKDINSILDIDKQLGEQYAAMYGSEKDFEYVKGTTLDEYKEQVESALKDRNGGKEYSSTTVQSFVDSLIKNNKDLLQQQSIENAKESLKNFSQEAQDAINNSGLSDEQMVTLVGSLNKDATIEQINNAIKEIQSTGEIQSVTIHGDYDDSLKSANDIESSLGSLFDKYEENGGFTDSEVADIIQENPEYVEYLTKVGDQWKLNQQALDDYNRSLEDQTAIVDDAMGGTSSFENYNDLLERISHPESHPNDSSGFSDEQTGEFTSASQDLDTQLANGDIGFTDYFNGISDALDSSGALDALDELNGAFDQTTDSLEEVASVAATQLSDGLIQANKAFVKGETSVSDYIDQLDAGLDAQQELLKSTYDLEDGTDGYVEASDDADEATQRAAKAYNEAEDAQKGLTQAAGFADTIQNNADLLSDYGQTLDDVFSDESIMSDNRLPQYINDLTNQFVEFAASSSANMQTATQQIAAATGESQEYIGQLLDQATSSDQEQAASAAATLASLTGSSMSSIQALTGAAMENVSNGISNASQAIGSVLSSLGEMISTFSFKIEASPYIHGPENGNWISRDEDGVINGINLPTFGFDIKGSGGESVSNFASALKNAGSYFTDAGNKQAAAEALDLSSYYPSGTGNGAVPSSGRGGAGKSGGGKGGSGGGSGGSGGGGGGSDKAYEPKTKEQQEDEIDRYERVNAELDTLSDRLDKIAEEQDRLAGFDVADNISEQIGLIKEQIKWENEKLKIQKQEAQEYRDQLASQYGIAYDAEGHITNYAETYKRLLDNLNGLINQYNATTTEEGQEALDEQIKAAQDNFDKYNDLIEKYDKLNSNSILETEKDIEDFYDKIEDLQIEAFQKAVDAVDNIQDLQESLIDFNAVFTGLNSDSPFRDMITSLDNLKTYWDVNTKAVDDYYDELIRRNKEAMKNASAQRKQELQYQNEVLEAARKQYGKQSFEAGGTGLFDMAMSNLNTILEQIRQYEESGTSTIFGENAGSMYEVGNDIFKQATELLSDYEGHLDDLKDAILDAIDEIGDKMDERLDTYKNINDELDHYADMIEMVQGENAYDQLNQTSQAMINNNQAQINELKQDIALWQDMLAAMEEGSDEWKAINEHITDAQQDLLELTSDTVQKMLDVYERGVNKILDKWVGSTGMGDDLDWISEEWELINRNADYYLDDVNAAYEIQKLQGKYLDLLDDSNGLDIQNQITQQMQQQLGYLREKDKLSEYDVQYANAQLEILQKTIALQEAQRNKSQLQLRRDTQGNYSYVYTADENDTRAAQSDLLDAQNNAYNLSKDQMKQTQDDSLSALQDARDTLEQIWTNANLTLEDKTKRTQTIIDSLKDYLAGTSEQLSESEKNIINDFLGMCEVLTDENDSRLQEVYDQIVNGNKDAFDQIDTRWQTSITNWLQHMEDFNTSTDESFQNLIDNFGGYQENLDELGNLAGMTFDDMSDSIQNAVDKTNDLANSTADFINQLKNDSGTVKEYEKSLAEMTAKIQDAENGMRAYQEQVNKLQSDLTEKEQENANLSSQVKDLQSQIDAMNNPAGAGGDGSGEGGGANTDTAWGIARAIWTYGGASGWGNDPIRSGKLIKAYGKDFAQQVQSIINQNTRSGKLVDYGSMKYSSYNLIGYRSGGYTGDDWTAAEKASGKIGLLHEKELVLNKTDTENILNAVDMVRSMVALGRNGNYNDIIRQSDNVVDMASVVKPLSDDMGQTIYQVECTFPNATGVDEIQKAILTLPDIAPQYAYKS